MKSFFKGYLQYLPHSFVSCAFLILSALSMLYFLIICYFASSWIWLGIAFLGLLASVLWYVLREKKGFRNVLLALSCLLIGAVLSLAARVVVNLGGNAQASYDYLIVLGAQVKGTEPSRILKDRLNKTLETWRQDPEVMIIVSGGKGEGEDITEAAAMKQYLMAFGVKEEQILLEEKAANTIENIRYSKELLLERNEDISSLTIGVVSSDFHLKRARYILAKNGLAFIGCLSARTYWLWLPHYIMRESAALVKTAFLLR